MRYMGVVMLLKVLAVSGWAALSVLSAASAQSLAGPAETPPPSFKGSQYVDSRGCVFLRAGIGGRVTWVPRISRSRKALCGQSPAEAAREVAVVAPAVQPTPPVTKLRNTVTQSSKTYGNAPMETIASLPRTPVRVAPRVVAKPAPQKVAVPPVVAAPRPAQPSARLNSNCPASSPYGARVTLTDGRNSLLCSADPRFDVRAAAARVSAAPVQKARTAPQPVPKTQIGRAPVPQPKAATMGAGYKCPPNAPVAKRFAIRGGGSTVMCTTTGGGIENATPPLALGQRSDLAIPKGYRKAWNDDRLNPLRGNRTALGQAQQDQVWTRDVPAQLVARVAPTQTTKRSVNATSTSNAPRNAVRGGYYVQIGTFGEPANAARSAASLRGLGLPVAKSRINSKGRRLQVVMVGPFGDTRSANAALSTARRSGFGDAFIR